jgi:hypothetical protein
MPTDYILHLACQPKLSLGSGDAIKGSDQLLQALKARHQAALIEETASKQGKSPSGIGLTIRSVGPDRTPVEKDVTYDQLVALAASLDARAEACADCPANLFSQPFGCYGVVPYPITRSAEEWLMDRVQPTSMVGGFLCHRAIQDFGYTGEPIRRMRAAGLLEGATAVSKVVEGGWLSKRRVTSDQILQGMLAIEEPLDPGHCMGVLLWLGCLQLDGRHLGDAGDAPLVQEIAGLATPESKRSRTSIDVTPAPQDRSTASLQGLLHAFYRAWVLDIRILVSY